MKIEITIGDLETLLRHQIALTIEQCATNSHYYNAKENKTLPIDKNKFEQNGKNVNFAPKFNALKIESLNKLI